MASRKSRTQRDKRAEAMAVHEVAGPELQVQACRPEDRAMLATPAGAELVTCVAEALADDERYFGKSEYEDMACEHCRGDGMDPDCDYLLPCPKCQGEQHV